MTHSYSLNGVSDLQMFQLLDKYSRYLPEEARRETWPEVVSRVVGFLRTTNGSRLTETEYQDIQRGIESMQVMPAMRLLATAGPTAARNNFAAYNCSFLGISSIDNFREALIILMNGAGVGYSVEQHYIAQLPVVTPHPYFGFGETADSYPGVSKRDLRQRYFDSQRPANAPFVIPDTTEGWGLALQYGIEMWMIGRDVTFDYSNLRPAGAPLLTKGGTASGPEPLRELLEFARLTILHAGGRQLTSLEVSDIMNKIGQVVVSGGHRRSSQIALFTAGDALMEHAKDPGFEDANPQRFAANFSAVWPADGSVTEEQFWSQWNTMIDGERGEPGIFNAAAALATMPERRTEVTETGAPVHFGTNPCVIGDTRVLTSEGVRLVAELVGVPFTAVVNGEQAASGPEGFWCTGVKPVFKLNTRQGYSVTATDNHKFLTASGEWKELGNLVPGDYLMINNHREFDPNVFTAEITEIEDAGVAPVYDCSIPGVNAFDANGFIAHNCGEILLRHKQTCNLSSIVVRETDTEATLTEKVRLATIIGTVQSMLDYFPGVDETWTRNQKDERLLGVDLNNITSNPLVRNPEVLQRLRAVAVATNREYAEKLGINASAAITTVKPSGNSSVLLNTASGVHAWHAPYYRRNVRVGRGTVMYNVLKHSGFTLAPDQGAGQFDPDTATIFVASFPVKAPEGAITRHDQSAIEAAELAILVRENWAEHNVSVTVNYRAEEAEELGRFVWANRNRINGMSFSPISEAKYFMMPYEELSREEYEAMVAEQPAVDWDYIEVLDKGGDETHASQVAACEGDRCVVELPWMKAAREAGTLGPVELVAVE